MPTDGTLLLEQLPRAKHYMLTGMSVFFSVGAVIACLIGLVIIPRNSCPATGACDADAQNNGWRYLLAALASLTATMFLCRMVFFHLHEFPRFLVATGRHDEALVSLRKISTFNGGTLSIGPEDVCDAAPAEDAAPSPAAESSGSRSPPSYDATGAPRQPAEAPEDEDPRKRRRRSASEATTASARHHTPVWLRPFPRIIRRPVLATLDKLGATLSPQWRATTLLIWAVWFLLSLGYTMVNVYMPKLLEGRTPHASENPELEASMWDLMVYTLAGCPGPLAAAWLVERDMGRSGALALSTFATAVFYALFTFARGRWLVWLSSFGSNLCASTMWAVLYGMTPEIFETEVRGTACGTASALSRVGGIIAPLLGGYLLLVDPSFTVYLSIVILLVAGVCVLCLKTARVGAPPPAGYEPVLVVAH